jgi:hypothetical protein
MNTTITHTPWCQDHTSGQCCSEPIDFAPHGDVWLTQLEQGTRLIVDGPPSGLELTIEQAYDLHDAIAQLREAALDHKPVNV